MSARVSHVLVLAADMSKSILVVLLGRVDDVRRLHEFLCRELLGWSKCKLHFKKLRASVKRRVPAVLSRAHELLSRLKIWVIVCTRRLKRVRHRVLELLLRIISRELSSEYALIVLPSELATLLKDVKNVAKRCSCRLTVIVDDKHDAVEVADVLANAFRRGFRSRHLRVLRL